MPDFSLPPNAEQALNRIQDTSLNPMEETLFKSWTRANQIEDPDSPQDMIDYRGIFQASNGAVLPGGELARQTQKQNDQMTIQKALQERMLARIDEMAGKQEDLSQQLHKEERQDITHKQKMEQEGLKLKRAPIDLKMKKHDLAAKKMDIEGKKLGLDAQKLGNEGKQIDLISMMMQPRQPMVPTGSPANKPTGNETTG